jgi:hypothetical protein
VPSALRPNPAKLDFRYAGTLYEIGGEDMMYEKRIYVI